jgi:hypothetical protein
VDMLLVKKIFTHRWKCWHGWVDPTWHRRMMTMYPTCIFVRYDSKYDRKLSTKWSNQGLLIDKTVDSGLSIFCQIRHPSPCSVFTLIIPKPLIHTFYFLRKSGHKCMLPNLSDWINTYLCLYLLFVSDTYYSSAPTYISKRTHFYPQP